jgi:formylglycine-generating enzyme required for sulfatase activity
MNALEHLRDFDMVYRLGWTLVHSLWIGVVVAALLSVTLVALRRRSPQARYLAACAAMILMAAAPIVTFPLVPAPAQPLVAVAIAASAAAPLPAVTLPDVPAAAPGVPAAAPPAVDPSSAGNETFAATVVRISHTLEPALPWLTLAWLCGVMALSLWRLAGWIGAQRLRRLAVPPSDPALAVRLKALARTLRVTRPVRLLESTLVRIPVVIGWLRPVILLPAGLATGLAADEIEAVLAHEFAHIRRLDYLVNLLQAAAETALFYHPAIWWVSRRIRAERENCCDDVAVGVLGNPVRYVEALATVANIGMPASASREPRPAVVALGTSGRNLVDRVRRLLGLPDPTCSSVAASATAILLLVALLTVSITIGVSCRGGATQPSDSKDANAAVEPTKELTLDLGNNATMKMVLIPAGKFMMSAGRPHEVTISKSFYMGATEVTQGQYQAIMGTNPSHFKGATNPVETVSWNDAAEFCKKLSKMTGRAVRLPTNAEWEYACRAGSTTPFFFGTSEADLGDYAWYSKNSGGTTHPVGQKKPNAWGLYDTYGNVWELSADWYGDVSKEAVTDPQGPASGKFRAMLGGSFLGSPSDCSSVGQAFSLPESGGSACGFRVVVLDVESTPLEAAVAADSSRAVAGSTPEATKSGVATWMELLNPTDKTLWGEAVGGARVRLRATKPQWTADEKPAFILDLSAIDRAIAFVDANTDDQRWAVEVDGRTYWWTQRKPSEDVAWSQTVEPHNGLLNAATLTLPGPFVAKDGGAPLVLAPGKHTVRLSLNAQVLPRPVPPAGTSLMPDKGFRVQTNAVEIEVLPDATSGAKAAGAAALKPVAGKEMVLSVRDDKVRIVVDGQDISSRGIQWQGSTAFFLQRNGQPVTCTIEAVGDQVKLTMEPPGSSIQAIRIVVNLQTGDAVAQGGLLPALKNLTEPAKPPAPRPAAESDKGGKDVDAAIADTQIGILTKFMAQEADLRVALAEARMEHGPNSADVKKLENQGAALQEVMVRQQDIVRQAQESAKSGEKPAAETPAPPVPPAAPAAAPAATPTATAKAAAAAPEGMPALLKDLAWGEPVGPMTEVALPGGVKAFTIILRQTSWELKHVPQSGDLSSKWVAEGMALPEAERLKMMDRIDDHVQVWLVPPPAQGLTPRAAETDRAADLKAALKPTDLPNRQFRELATMGSGRGYYWYAYAPIYSWVRAQKQLKLEGGDDPVAASVRGMGIEDRGFCTRNSCEYEVGVYGAQSIPFVEKALAKDPKLANYMIYALSHSKDPKVTAWLLKQAESTDADAARSAKRNLAVNPRPEATDAYLKWLEEDIISGKPGQPAARGWELIEACRAVKAPGLEKLLPRVLEAPRSVRDYWAAIVASHELAGRPVPQALLDATSQVIQTGNKLSDKFDQARVDAVVKTVLASDPDVAAIIGLKLALQGDFKSQSQPTRDAGMAILKAVPDGRSPRLATLLTRTATQEYDWVKQDLAKVATALESTPAAAPPAP